MKCHNLFNHILFFTVTCENVTNFIYILYVTPYINLMHTLGQHWYLKREFIVMSSFTETIFNKVNLIK